MYRLAHQIQAYGNKPVDEDLQYDISAELPKADIYIVDKIADYFFRYSNRRPHEWDAGRDFPDCTPLGRQYMLEFMQPRDPYQEFVDGQVFQQIMHGVYFEALDLELVRARVSEEHPKLTEESLEACRKQISQNLAQLPGETDESLWWKVFGHTLCAVPEGDAIHAWAAAVATGLAYNVRWIVFAFNFYAFTPNESSGPAAEMIYPLDKTGRLIEDKEDGGYHFSGRIATGVEEGKARDIEKDINKLLAFINISLYPALLATSLINCGEASIYNHSHAPGLQKAFLKKTGQEMKPLKRVEPQGLMANRIGNSNARAADFPTLLETRSQARIPACVTRAEILDIERLAERAGFSASPESVESAEQLHTGSPRKVFSEGEAKDFSQIHPFRYQRLRPFAKTLVEELKRARKLTNADERSRAYMEATNRYGALFQEMLRHTGGAEKRAANMARTSDLRNELYALQQHSAFEFGGGNIFYINRELTEEFVHTDVGEVPFEELRLPYEALYLAFDLRGCDARQFELWEPGQIIDGAYLTRFGDGPLQVLLTSRRADVDYQSKRTAFARADRYYLFSFQNTRKDLTVAQAIEDALTNPKTFSPLGSSEIHEKFWADGDVSLSFDLSAFDEDRDEPLEMKYRGLGSFEEALKLIINGLAYMTSYPEEVEKRFPPGAPEKLVKKLESSKTQKERERNRSKLHALGFTEIHYCGRQLVPAAVADPSSARTGREVSTHWRRGHWRLQPFGPVKSESRPSRLRWIRPTLVRRDRQEEADHTHLYIMEKRG